MQSHRIGTGLLIGLIMCGAAYSPTLAHTMPDNSGNMSTESDVSSSIPIHNTYPKNSFAEETSDSHIDVVALPDTLDGPEKPTVHTGGGEKPRTTWPLFLFAGIISLIGVIATTFTGIRKN